MNSRERTVVICFRSPSLGNQKLEDGSGRFVFQRSPEGHILFLPSWHQANLAWASRAVGQYQQDALRVWWEPQIEGTLRENCWVRHYYKKRSGKTCWSVHQAFAPGQIVRAHCAVPERLPDGDLQRLLQKAGEVRGLSPWRPGQYGFFDVLEITRRRRLPFPRDDA